MDLEVLHTPVMVKEVLGFLPNIEQGVVIDATFGFGGHAKAILSRYPEIFLIGIDRDWESIKRAADTLRGFGRRLAILHIRYDEPGAFDKAVAVAMEVVEASSKTTIFPVAAVLLDLGVNSYQLDEGSRGFSYTKPGPLDMRMDTSKGVTASQFLQEVSFADLKELFYENGEYKYATKLAKEIISHNPITTTQELSQIVEGVIPKSMRRRGHPAKRVFQALRIAVNEEITFLADALGAAFEVLTVGGRLLVLSYHSGEDRTVKNKFSLFATGGCSCPKNLPCRCGALIKGKLLTKGSLVPTKEEIADNPRAASARLRVIEKIQPIYLKDFQ